MLSKDTKIYFSTYAQIEEVFSIINMNGTLF